MSHVLRVLVLILACTLGSHLDAQSFPENAQWPAAKPQSLNVNGRLLEQAKDYAQTGGGSGIVIFRGKAVINWGDLNRKYDLKSTSKSIGVTSFGLAIQDGLLTPEDLAHQKHPSFGVPPDSNRNKEWIKQVTLRHLANQTAGFEKPGGYKPIVFAPGTGWLYSDGGPNWLAEVVTLAYKQDIESLMFERIFTPIGVTRDDLHWRKHAYRDAKIDGIRRCEFGSGVHANVRAMACLGYLYLNRGRWGDRRLLNANFIDEVRRPDPHLKGLPVTREKDFGPASDHYGWLWWNNGDGSIANVPRDAYWSWGLYDSLIIVIPSLDLVVARAGKSWKRKSGASHYAVLEPFLQPLVRAVTQQPSSTNEASTDSNAQTSAAPYPMSSRFRVSEWADAKSVIRLAKGGDNWPIAWGADGALYTAFGDGWGFQHKSKEKKLSLGICRVEGDPPNITGHDIAAPSIEQYGGGPSGGKASGMLMVDGVLYMWVRNRANAQLAVSRDQGSTWRWVDWKWTTSFGAPTFLTAGPDHKDAPDEFVYVVSQDHDSAYKPADQMVMARVPRQRITDQDAYQFFAGMNSHGQPKWSSKVEDRSGVFRHAGRCYRSGLSYHAKLNRYLWVQVIPGGDTRFKGGLGIYDAPAPWGPWTTVYFSEKWDMGPGETASVPAKWLDAERMTMHLVFSGDDYFSVRRAQLVK